MKKASGHSPLLLLSIVFVAANMRLPITLMPPLLDTIKQTFHIPTALSGLLTTIPLLTFAIMSPFIAKLGKRFGNEVIIYILLIVLAIGSAVRIIPDVIALFLGTLFIAIGIDGGNVLIPAVIKDHYAHRTEAITAIFTMSMLIVGALGTGLAGWLIARTTLSWTLGLLSIIAIINLILWFPNLHYRQTQNISTTATATAAPGDSPSVWRLPTAWLITLFFGLQSLVFYSLLTWLPSILTTQGFSTIEAGNIATIMQVGTLPAAILVPMLVRYHYGVPSILGLVFIGLSLAVFGLLLPIQSLLIHMILAFLIGLGCGASFNLAIIFFTSKTQTGHQTADLSGMAQSAGYLLAAFGPLAFGLLQSLTSSWISTILTIAILSVILVLCGISIHRRDTIMQQKTQ